MKKVFIILSLGFVLFTASCSRWPSVIIGDSSGYLQYNRSTGILEVLWEKHVQVQDTTKILPSSTNSNASE